MKITVISTLAILIILIISAILYGIKTNYSPEQDVNRAAKILSEANNEKCLVYAKDLFLKAKENYDLALTEWKFQNERFILLRNFNKVNKYANNTVEIAQKAILISKEKSSSTTKLLQNRIANLDSAFNEFDRCFVRFLSFKEHRNKYTIAKLHFTECKLMYEKSDYTNCTNKLNDVEKSIQELSDYYTNKIKEYFEEYPLWRKMVNETILFSKINHVFAIVVDKYSKQLFLYKNGNIKKIYFIESGTSQLGNKLQKGDNFTPEGLYKIAEKKQGRQTKFYKAFLLNYPNDEDKKRFLINKKNGLLKKNAQIGSLIEIHGNGNKGTDWTNGCIAISDTDMDEIYKSCQLDTKVTIVGSIKSLNELSIIKK